MSLVSVLVLVGRD